MAPASDEIRAQLEVVELEEELVKAKKGNVPPDKLAEIKNKLRAAREQARQDRGPAREGQVRPDTVKAGVKAHSPGGVS